MGDSSNIIPGLFDLNLNIMFPNDIYSIEDTIPSLYKRLTQEHKVVHNVLNNMIAVVKSKPWRGKNDSIICLEKILERDPRNLNALSDIEFLCRVITELMKLTCTRKR